MKPILFYSRCWLIVLSLSLASGAFAAPVAVLSVQTNSDGMTLEMSKGVLKLRVFAPRVIEVIYAPGKQLPEVGSLAVIGRPLQTQWKPAESEKNISLQTGELEVRVNCLTGAVGFYNSKGEPILLEAPDGGKAMIPRQVAGVDTRRSQQAFELAPDEAIYGLGQHAEGLMNYRGSSVHLQQRNPTESAVPVLVSSRGYGVLWDNPAVTDVDCGKTDPRRLTWSSEAAETIDYYFMFGPDLDRVIAGYRDLTGAAPLFAKWTFGFWQSKARYKSQQELLDVAGWYRKNNVPLDGLIQDWLYWDPHPWGSHELDARRYPDPKKLMQKLHDENVHLIISVWPKFDVDSTNANQLRAADALYPQVLPYIYPKGEGQWYDPFTPVARKLYWEQISRELFSFGLDGWWLDASEPELSGKWGEFRNLKTAAGAGAEVFNAYPLMHTSAVYAGQRAETSAKRVFILTRSAYAGEQRNGAMVWSGDTHGNWETLARQIPAGLNFSISGIPYWNTDTGGFVSDNPTNEAYAELFTRWFQFSTFCPMLRVHGIRNAKEIWRFPPDTQKILIGYDRLRYHLLPYIYSMAWQVTSAGYTMLRPLVMDYRHDTNVFDIADQFQFGPALMVCPVTVAGADHRSVYLPAGRTWTDFWTSKTFAGGKRVEAESPIQTVPLFVPAGSIFPYGPEIEYAAEKSDPIELRIYRGADGGFTFYEDEGDNYDYEKGAFATIPIRWNEGKQTLTIGRRSGTFPGMKPEHTFQIVWVSPGHGAGVESTANPDRIVEYDGREIVVPGPKR